MAGSILKMVTERRGGLEPCKEFVRYLLVKCCHADPNFSCYIVYYRPRNVLISRYGKGMERESRQAGDAGKILVQSEHAGAMLQRNRRDECINGCQTPALGAGNPENRRRFPVGPEATGLEHFQLRKIVFYRLTS